MNYVRMSNQWSKTTRGVPYYAVCIIVGRVCKALVHLVECSASPGIAWAVGGASDMRFSGMLNTNTPRARYESDCCCVG